MNRAYRAQHTVSQEWPAPILALIAVHAAVPVPPEHALGDAAAPLPTASLVGAGFPLRLQRGVSASRPVHAVTHGVERGGVANGAAPLTHSSATRMNGG